MTNLPQLSVSTLLWWWCKIQCVFSFEKDVCPGQGPEGGGCLQVVTCLDALLPCEYKIG
jgi:hypothetical protein